VGEHNQQQCYAAAVRGAQRLQNAALEGMPLAQDCYRTWKVARFDGSNSFDSDRPESVARQLSSVVAGLGRGLGKLQLAHDLAQVVQRSFRAAPPAQDHKIVRIR
jgi:hypothetical protein